VGTERRRDTKGLTPWDFLRIGLAGDEGSAEVQQARALFREYAVAIRGSIRCDLVEVSKRGWAWPM
jgi:hypothetical protein